jgi:hypothetical protein
MVSLRSYFPIIRCSVRIYLLFCRRAHVLYMLYLFVTSNGVHVLTVCMSNMAHVLYMLYLFVTSNGVHVLTVCMSNMASVL